MCQNELAGDDGTKRFERQRKARTASFSLRDDGMWQLFALFDPTAAARVSGQPPPTARRSRLSRIPTGCQTPRQSPS